MISRSQAVAEAIARRREAIPLACFTGSLLVSLVAFSGVTIAVKGWEDTYLLTLVAAWVLGYLLVSRVREVLAHDRAIVEAAKNWGSLW